MVRLSLVLFLAAAGVLGPRSASAITLDQVIALSQSGVTETVILALIDRDRTVFAIEPEQVVTLQRDGLSERLILAMLKSGRAEGDAAARVDAANNSAWIASNLATEPLTVTVGHGPDRPNTPHIDGFWSGPPAAAASFAVPYAAYTAPPFRYRAPAFGSHRSTDQKALCYAQVNSLRSTVQSSPFVTVCPDVMQPTLLRR